MLIKSREINIVDIILKRIMLVQQRRRNFVCVWIKIANYFIYHFYQKREYDDKWITIKLLSLSDTVLHQYTHGEVLW